MAKKKQSAPVEIRPPVVEMIPMNLLELNPDNPKKPMSKDRLRGLNRSLTEFGLRDMIKVAPHPEIEGAYLVLDGNTRIEELRKRADEGVKIPCLVHSDLTTREKITEFVLTFDRNVKAYDETAVMAQLKGLVDAGEDVEMLAELVNLPDLQKYIDGMLGPENESLLENLISTSLVEQDIITISGPKSDIDGIMGLLKTINVKMEQSARVRLIMESVDEFDWRDDGNDDEALLFILLAVAAHLRNTADKIIIPCSSFVQKEKILKRLAGIIERKNLTGPSALGDAAESVAGKK
jgi:hypothetical protein